MDERRRRTNVIRKISTQKRSELGARYLGAQVKVLFEEQSEGLWSGHAGNYLEVKVKTAKNLSNQIETVVIKEVCGEWVLGEVSPA